MGKYRTKYFGKISIDETSDFEYIDVKYKNKDINISLFDCNIYGDRLKTCLELLDSYIEINEMAKESLLEDYPENETIRHYFECHFAILDKEKALEVFGVETFDELDIKKAIEELAYPDLLFGIVGEELDFSVDYRVAAKYSDETLCVKMDYMTNVLGYSQEG